MQITASATRPGDMLRGIGLFVEFSEPETDYSTRITGYVVTDRETDERFGGITLVLPNEHKVGVRRLFEVNDIVTIPVYMLDEDAEDFMDEAYVRMVVAAVDPEAKTLQLSREGDPTEAWVTAPFFRARHAA